MSVIGFLADGLGTAMRILPHTGITRVTETALPLNILWPHLPEISTDEDMYVRALDPFSGVRIDPLERKMFFDPDRFYEEIPACFEEADAPEIFRLTKTFSLVYHRFLESDLLRDRVIWGQRMSPIRLGPKGCGLGPRVDPLPR
jgi:hypothetical protein